MTDIHGPIYISLYDTTLSINKKNIYLHVLGYMSFNTFLTLTLPLVPLNAARNLIGD